MAFLREGLIRHWVNIHNHQLELLQENRYDALLRGRRALVDAMRETWEDMTIEERREANRRGNEYVNRIPPGRRQLLETLIGTIDRQIPPPEVVDPLQDMGPDVMFAPGMVQIEDEEEETSDEEEEPQEEIPTENANEMRRPRRTNRTIIPDFFDHRLRQRVGIIPRDDDMEETISI
jgi:hypothetical protein